MRIKAPKFVRKMVCNYLSKTIEEETGIRTNIEIESVVIDTKGENYRVSMAENININKKDLKKFIKESIKNEL